MTVVRVRRFLPTVLRSFSVFQRFALLFPSDETAVIFIETTKKGRRFRVSLLALLYFIYIYFQVENLFFSANAFYANGDSRDWASLGYV